mgnify:CR=1 FL=1
MSIQAPQIPQNGEPENIFPASSRKAVRVCRASISDEIYDNDLSVASTSGNLVCYDIEDGSVKTYDCLHDLSDKEIAHISYNKATDRLVIIYVNGNIKNKNKNLKIICEDIYLMDIGSHTFTEFDMSPEVCGYIVENDLTDCQMGLIHSHCDFATYFSNTDTNTLKEEGSTRNHFVSLIVNNDGPYTAAITRISNIISLLLLLLNLTNLLHRFAYLQINPKSEDYDIQDNGESILV